MGQLTLSKCRIITLVQLIQLLPVLKKNSNVNSSLRRGYTQGHRIVTYNDPFKLVPTSQLATIGDSLLRNRILTSNEFRAVIGYGPITDPMADQLYNPNIADNIKMFLYLGRSRPLKMKATKRIQKNWMKTAISST